MGAAADFTERLRSPRYPRSSHYDAAWLLDNIMGPNPLWLTESLLDVMAIRAADRVMDLGCGKALSSIFVAREIGAHVTAVDLWIDAEENAERIRAAGLDDLVETVHADAMRLPFPDAAFDVIVSVDAYHYFGTDPKSLPAIIRVLRKGGTVGVVVPGLDHELASWPESLRPWWQDGFATFHSPGWWKELIEGSGLVTVDRADTLPHGHASWLHWGKVADDWAVAQGREPYRDEVAMLQADTDELLGFTRIIATKL